MRGKVGRISEKYILQLGLKDYVRRFRKDIRR